MEDVGGVVHILLEGAIEMGECLSTAGEPETLAEVVTTLGAVSTVITHNTGLDGYSLADYKVLDT